MTSRRALFAIPAIFVAAVTAGACSSSSNSGTTTTSGGSDSGSSATNTSGGAGGGCAALEACCPNLPTAMAITECSGVVSANNTANCATELTTVIKAGYCSAASSTVSTVSTSGATTSKSSSSSAVTTTGTCASPPTVLPSGFAAPTGIVGSGCTSAEAEAWGKCQVSFPTTDAGINACDANLFEADGNPNTCGLCILFNGNEAILAPDTPIPTQWGTNIIAAIEPTVGASEQDWYPVNFGPNLGGCVVGADTTTAGKQCGIDLMTVTACEFAVCLPLCAVSEAASQTATGFDDLFDCTDKADMGACAKYVMARDTDCGALIHDSGTDPVSKCQNLVDMDALPDAGGGTQASQAALIGITCGGYDAGF